MSDCFNHEADAWDSLDDYGCEQEDDGGAWYRAHTPRRKPRTACRYCKATGLHWKETTNGWRLVSNETGDIHTCAEYRAAQATKELT